MDADPTPAALPRLAISVKSVTWNSGMALMASDAKHLLQFYIVLVSAGFAHNLLFNHVSTTANVGQVTVPLALREVQSNHATARIPTYEMAAPEIGVIAFCHAS